jgi:holliday junction DNA helicase RuvB
MVGEEAATIEDVIEPFLIKIGLIERTPRGRVITMKGISYIKSN